MKENSDRWLIDGDCSKCRRRQYCSKDCTKRKRSMNRMIRDFIGVNTGLDILRKHIKKFY